MQINPNDYPYLEDYQSKVGGVEKRIIEIELLLDSFVKIISTTNNEVTDSYDTSKTALNIAENYYKILNQFKRFVTSKNNDENNKVNIFKIISGLELAICELKPITLKEPENEEKINAQFAFFTGLGFLTGFYKESFLHYTYPNLDLIENEELTNLISEHIDFLCMIEGNFHLPYFSNAQTWWALKMLMKELNDRN